VIKTFFSFNIVSNELISEKKNQQTKVGNKFT